MKKTWHDVTIETWQELEAIQTDSEVTRYIEQIAILSDNDPDFIRNLNIKDFNQLRADLAFMSEPPNKDIMFTFELEGVKYGIIPQMDFITAGEWLDADSWKEKPEENIHLYAALIFRPIVEETATGYTIEKHKADGFLERANLFKKKLPITHVYGGVLFFSSFVIDVTKILVDYLNEQIQEDPNLMKMTQIQTLMTKLND